MPEWVFRAPGLVIDGARQWLAATRDWEVGEYGLVEVKSYAKWITTLPFNGVFRDQVLTQMFVWNSASGKRRRWTLFLQLKLSAAQSAFAPFNIEKVLQWYRSGVLRARFHFVTLDETPESKKELDAFIEQLGLGPDEYTRKDYSSADFLKDQVQK